MRRLRQTEVDRERGAVGGIEVIPFGILLFVVGTLLITNAWSLIDARLAAAAGAREAARAYVESDGSSAAYADAVARGEQAMASYGKDRSRIRIERIDGAAFRRCARVEFEASYEVPAISLPFVTGFGDHVVRADHSEIVDPFRAGLPEGNDCDF